MNPYIEFYIDQASQAPPKLKASIHSDEVPQSDLRMRYARLALRCTAQFAAEAPAMQFDPAALASQVRARLVLLQHDTHGDGDQFFEYEDDFDLPHERNVQSPGEAGMGVGFQLRIINPDGAERWEERPFGWASSPAVVAAVQVSRMIRHEIERAAQKDPVLAAPEPDEGPRI